MASNLFISYDLYEPGQKYEQVAEAIKQLGKSVKVQNTFWYVHTDRSAAQAAEIVGAVLDQNDSLVVIDATNNHADWRNLGAGVGDFIEKCWRT